MTRHLIKAVVQLKILENLNVIQINLITDPLVIKKRDFECVDDFHSNIIIFLRN